MAELRSFYVDISEYQAILTELWRRNPSDGYLSLANAEAKQRLANLRRDLTLRYGRLRPAIAEPQGGIPILGNAFSTAGECFLVALADPLGNPWLFSALDASVQTTAIAVGHFEQSQRDDIVALTSPVYWWRRSRSRVVAIYAEIKDWLGIVAKLKP